MKQFIELFKDKFKEVLNLNLHVEEIAKSEEDLKSITLEGQNKSQ